MSCLSGYDAGRILLTAIEKDLQRLGKNDRIVYDLPFQIKDSLNRDHDSQSLVEEHQDDLSFKLLSASIALLALKRRRGINKY